MNYRFANLLGAPYRGGNLVLHDGHIYSSVGNRITKVDLAQNVSCTLPFENSKNIRNIAVSPSGTLLLAIDEEGRSLLINNRRRVVLHHFSFRGAVAAAKFSPAGDHFAVAVGRLLQVWRAPGIQKEFAPFQLHRSYGGLHDTATCLDWSPDSRWLAVGSKDLSVKVFSLDPIEGYTPFTLTGHRDALVGVFFTDESALYTVSRDGALFKWRFQPAAEGGEGGGSTEGGAEVDLAHGSWRLEGKHFFNRRGAKLICAAYHPASELLVAGFSSGTFDLHQLPGFESLHSLSVSREALTSVTFDASGEWIGLGCGALGQLLVWEWRSETYVLKQQGHHFDVNCAGYSPDGGVIATGADDAKLKLWNPASGFCYVTFTEHSMPVTAVAFMPTGHAVMSASLDGTVRAFDLVRYRNFRTFTAPQPAQFASVAIDAAGEVVAAGALDTFAVYVWSVKTGRVLDVLAGHEGPVCSLSFSPTLPILASASWDKTVRTWDVFAGKGSTESLPHTHDVLCLAFRPDGKQLCSATLDGQLYFWDPADGVLQGTIEGRRDIAGGRLAGDRRSYENSSSGRCFTTLCYSADGAFLLAAGSSKYICMYDVAERVMLRRFQVTHNRSLDGVMDEVSSRGMTDAGPLGLIDDGEDDDGWAAYGRAGPAEGAADLPGTSKGKLATVRCKCVRFAPTGRSWLAATTEGLLVYSLDEGLAFDPTDLDEDVTPAAVVAAQRRGEHLRALLLAIRLGDVPLVRAVVAEVPPSQVPAVARGVPAPALGKLLGSLAESLASSPHLEFLLAWVQALCTAHGPLLRERGHEMLPALRALQHVAGRLHEDLSSTCQENIHTLEYLAAASLAEEGRGA